MTKKQRSLHKLGNALRAFRGTMFNAPQKMAKARAMRWLNRCKDYGYIHPELWKINTTKP